jgi:hypothetical protein
MYLVMPLAVFGIDSLSGEPDAPPTKPTELI